MGKTKEMALEISIDQQDTDRYFQWLSDSEWQAHVEKCEEYCNKKYGYGLMAKIKLSEMLKRKDNGK